MRRNAVSRSSCVVAQQVQARTCGVRDVTDLARRRVPRRRARRRPPASTGQPARVERRPSTARLGGAHDACPARRPGPCTRAGVHEPAPGDDHHVVDGLLHLGQHVAGDQHGAALAGQVPQEAAQPGDALRVQAVRRLVEQQHAAGRPAGRRPGRAAGACRARSRRRAGRPRRSRPTSASTSSARRSRDAGRRASTAQVVARGAARVEAGRLQRRRRPCAAGRASSAYGAADGRGPGRRPDQPEQHPQRRGLAGAVRAEEAGDPAGLDIEKVRSSTATHRAEPLGQAARSRCAGRPRQGWVVMRLACRSTPRSTVPDQTRSVGRHAGAAVARLGQRHPHVAAGRRSATWMGPPCRSTAQRAIARPRPVPPSARRRPARGGTARTRASRSAGAMPGPSSTTSSRTPARALGAPWS